MHTNVSIEHRDDGKAALKIRIPRGHGFLDRFRPPVVERTYELDDFGAFVVAQIDGRRDVMEIIRAFERRFKVNHREAELSIVAFLKMLMQRGIVSVGIR